MTYESSKSLDFQMLLLDFGYRRRHHQEFKANHFPSFQTIFIIQYVLQLTRCVLRLPFVAVTGNTPVPFFTLVTRSCPHTRPYGPG